MYNIAGLSASSLIFASLTSAATISRRISNSTNAAPAVSTNLPTGWTYQGCFTDSVSNRQLTGASTHDPSGMTEESCISFCSSNGYSVAGVEYGQECYCDFQLGSASVQSPDTDCSMTCSGNANELCGAGDRLTVFGNGAAPPSTNPGLNGWTSLGCYSDSVSARTLSTSQNVNAGSSGMTVAQCTAACQAGGYQFAGVEYASECYCDNQIENGATSGMTGCSMTCSGNSSEYCGGPARINIYQLQGYQAPQSGSLPSGWVSQGCYTDNVSARSLAKSVSVPGGSSSMTIESCLSTCQSMGYALAGLEYSQECWCDNQIENGASPASSGCDMPCKGNTAETCGGPNRLNLYSLGQLPPGLNTPFFYLQAATVAAPKGATGRALAPAQGTYLQLYSTGNSVGSEDGVFTVPSAAAPATPFYVNSQNQLVNAGDGFILNTYSTSASNIVNFDSNPYGTYGWYPPTCAFGSASVSSSGPNVALTCTLRSMNQWSICTPQSRQPAFVTNQLYMTQNAAKQGGCAGVSVVAVPAPAPTQPSSS